MGMIIQKNLTFDNDNLKLPPLRLQKLKEFEKENLDFNSQSGYISLKSSSLEKYGIDPNVVNLLCKQINSTTSSSVLYSAISAMIYFKELSKVRQKNLNSIPLFILNLKEQFPPQLSNILAGLDSSDELLVQVEDELLEQIISKYIVFDNLKNRLVDEKPISLEKYLRVILKWITQQVCSFSSVLVKISTSTLKWLAIALAAIEGSQTTRIVGYLVQTQGKQVIWESSI
eukprot:c850_g1_i1.p1 GENE.c850_g1_i1~~c850_g1_i1.p1  ORF type:complete len:239 (+),score=84.65 c850_g1_i1:31-717(+)